MTPKRWLERSKTTAHGLLPQAEEAPSWKWANPEETGSPQGSWALAKRLQRVFPSNGPPRPTRCIWKHHSERWRLNVVSVSSQPQVQTILSEGPVAKYRKEHRDTDRDGTFLKIERTCKLWPRHAGPQPQLVCDGMGRSESTTHGSDDSKFHSIFKQVCLTCSSQCRRSSHSSTSGSDNIEALN